ncbi:MAG: NADPH-dependent F420 reductase [Rhodospirillaceae bacterium]|jgi:8-hydroxy-5-deazaflavin:NADPH oxidoreductase|nr:NADPH-dependent F420 reductase [Rhodospirillaceae bacterium]
MKQDGKQIAIIGGGGALGMGLALRWAQAGHRIVIGSRDPARGVEAAQQINNTISEGTAIGCGNDDAAIAGDIVVLTVPFAHHAETLGAIGPHLAGKILVDVTVPLVPPKVRTAQLPPGGSCAKTAQESLGPGTRVVSAFQNVAAAHLADPNHDIECDVLVCGNDPAARAEVIELAEDAGMRAFHAGRIDNSVVAETLTSALIFINHHYKIDGAGIRITGTPAGSD